MKIVAELCDPLASWGLNGPLPFNPNCFETQFNMVLGMCKWWWSSEAEWAGNNLVLGFGCLQTPLNNYSFVHLAMLFIWILRWMSAECYPLHTSSLLFHPHLVVPLALLNFSTRETDGQKADTVTFLSFLCHLKTKKIHLGKLLWARWEVMLLKAMKVVAWENLVLWGARMNVERNTEE